MPPIRTISKQKVMKKKERLKIVLNRSEEVPPQEKPVQSSSNTKSLSISSSHRKKEDRNHKNKTSSKEEHNNTNNNSKTTLETRVKTDNLKSKRKLEEFSSSEESNDEDENPRKKKKNVKTKPEKQEFKTKIIGRREMIHFPELGVINLLAKVDTGANTSCIDVTNIRHDKTAKTISFDVVLDRHDRSSVQTILDFPFSNTTKKVTSSNGHVSTRYVLKTVVSIGPEFQNQVAEFTLVERHNLACPVLIGRNIIRMAGFLVDCNRTFITGKKQKTTVQSPTHVPVDKE